MLVDAALNAEAFATEGNYDTLTIGGTVFSGSNGPSDFVVTAGTEIVWQSDGDTTYSGFSICGAAPPTPSPTLGPGGIPV